MRSKMANAKTLAVKEGDGVESCSRRYIKFCLFIDQNSSFSGRFDTFCPVWQRRRLTSSVLARPLLLVGRSEQKKRWKEEWNL
jgi:hypothetical protein